MRNNIIYSFNLNNRAFKAIKEGKKRFENRVTKIGGIFNYSVLEPNDYIKFTSFNGERLIVKVLYVNWYSSAEELLMTEGCKYTLSSTNDFKKGVMSLQSFPGYLDGMRINGIFCIRIEAVDEIPNKIKLNVFNCVNDNIKLDDYIKCMDKVKEDMEFADWLGDFSKEELEKLLVFGSKIWMYYHKGNFVSSMMFIPADEKAIEDFGINIEYHNVADYGPMMVNSKYRGNDLQYQMLLELDDYCRKCGYEYAVSTVHPDNIFSIRNLVRDGFQLIGNKDFKWGNRNIYMKNLKE